MDQSAPVGVFGEAERLVHQEKKGTPEMMHISQARVVWGRTVALAMLLALAAALALLFAAPGARGQPDEVRSPSPLEQSGEMGKAAYMPDSPRSCSVRPSRRAPSG
jgi:hypothetical protein